MAAPDESLSYDEGLQWLLKSEALEQSDLARMSPSPSPALNESDAATEDDDSLPPSSSSKSTAGRNAKKVQLKHVKALLCISRAEGHQPLPSLLSFTPTSAVYIHGAGASCGLKYDDVSSAFSTLGPITSLTMVGFLPFILLQFRDTAAAVRCRQLHHKQKQPGVCQGRLLFVEFAYIAASTLLADNPALLLPNASSTQRPEVKGLVVLEDFVSEAEEEALLGYLQGQPWLEHRFRSVQHYGYAFDYERNDVFDRMRTHRDRADADDDLHMFPPILHPLIRRFRDLPSLSSMADHAPADCSETAFIPNQLTVNRYESGDGIPAHVDVHSSFTSFVLSLSLAAPIVMDFVPFPEAEGEEAAAPFPLLLPRRSLLVLSHYARYGCQHAIQPRKTDRVDGRLVERRERVSLTFRRKRVGGECHCQWRRLCDTASGVRKKDKKFVPFEQSRRHDEQGEEEKEAVECGEGAEEGGNSGVG